MPISADQWRVVIGCNNVRRHRQIDLKQFCLEKMIFGGSSIQLDLSDLSQLDAVVQEVRKDAETSHSATLNGKLYTGIRGMIVIFLPKV